MATTPDYTQWKEVNVYGSDFRPLLKEMADTVDRLELWDWFKNEDPPEDRGYMYWGHENIDKISKGLPSNPHSGATFGYAMRCMQAIAKQGFNHWNGVPS
tara:strand:+ start:11253 stop:11552 length:300 start_codon:yes stop_codon:yes gene_type:complete